MWLLIDACEDKDGRLPFELAAAVRFNEAVLLKKLNISLRSNGAANGRAHLLVTDTVDDMLNRMPIPSPRGNKESGFQDGPQCDAQRLIRIALCHKRTHTERLVDNLLVAIKTEIGLVEGRILAKIEDVDTSVGLVAGELARRSNYQPSNGAV